ncbi:hypothetical protein HDU96_006861 [Phlyctochytrium bullatum]|nr:hypothetical protein HDU96_006861 [Phlyctochytrium bullatum]
MAAAAVLAAAQKVGINRHPIASAATLKQVPLPGLPLKAGPLLTSQAPATTPQTPAPAETMHHAHHPTPHQLATAHLTHSHQHPQLQLHHPSMGWGGSQSLRENDVSHTSNSGDNNSFYRFIDLDNTSTPEETTSLGNHPAGQYLETSAGATTSQQSTVQGSEKSLSQQHLHTAAGSAPTADTAGDAVGTLSAVVAGSKSMAMGGMVPPLQSQSSTDTIIVPGNGSDPAISPTVLTHLAGLGVSETPATPSPAKPSAPLLHIQPHPAPQPSAGTASQATPHQTHRVLIPNLAPSPSANTAYGVPIQPMQMLHPAPTHHHPNLAPHPGQLQHLGTGAQRIAPNIHPATVSSAAAVAAAAAAAAAGLKKTPSKLTVDTSSPKMQKQHSGADVTAPTTAPAKGKGSKRQHKRAQDDLDLAPGEEWKCVECGVREHETPLKRKGPDKKRNLCNACYVRWRVRAERAERGSARPVLSENGQYAASNTSGPAAGASTANTGFVSGHGGAGNAFGAGQHVGGAGGASRLTFPQPSTTSAKIEIPASPMSSKFAHTGPGGAGSAGSTAAAAAAAVAAAVAAASAGNPHHHGSGVIGLPGASMFAGSVPSTGAVNSRSSSFLIGRQSSAVSMMGIPTGGTGSRRSSMVDMFATPGSAGQSLAAHHGLPHHLGAAFQQGMMGGGAGDAAHGAPSPAAMAAALAAHVAAAEAAGLGGMTNWTSYMMAAGAGALDDNAIGTPLMNGGAAPAGLGYHPEMMIGTSVAHPLAPQPQQQLVAFGGGVQDAGSAAAAQHQVMYGTAAGAPRVAALPGQRQQPIQPAAPQPPVPPSHSTSQAAMLQEDEFITFGGGMGELTDLSAFHNGAASAGAGPVFGWTTPGNGARTAVGNGSNTQDPTAAAVAAALQPFYDPLTGTSQHHMDGTAASTAATATTTAALAALSTHDTLMGDFPTTGIFATPSSAGATSVMVGGGNGSGYGDALMGLTGTHPGYFGLFEDGSAYSPLGASSGGAATAVVSPEFHDDRYGLYDVNLGGLDVLGDGGDGHGATDTVSIKELLEGPFHGLEDTPTAITFGYTNTANLLNPTTFGSSSSPVKDSEQASPSSGANTAVAPSPATKVPSLLPRPSKRKSATEDEIEADLTAATAASPQAGNKGGASSKGRGSGKAAASKKAEKVVLAGSPVKAKKGKH